MGDIVADEAILETARIEATELLDDPTWMEKAENQSLVKALKEKLEETEYFD